ncbi:MAG: hypothetical protein ACRCYU_09275 [Nocardioides sp.]
MHALAQPGPVLKAGRLEACPANAGGLFVVGGDPMKVTVLHNVARDGFGRPRGYDGYQPDHQLANVFDYETDLVAPLAVAEQAFHLFNVGDDPHFGTPHPTAIAYRANQLRSLSVGDVLLLEDGAHGTPVAYACASVGWTPLAEIPRPNRRRGTCHCGSPAQGAGEFPNVCTQWPLCERKEQ